MLRSMWKTVILVGVTFLALMVVVLGTGVFSDKALAKGPTYVPCQDTTWVTEATASGSGTGVKVQGLIRGLMDARNNATYCGQMVTWAIVTTTHTGQLEANLYGKGTTLCDVPGGGDACPRSGNTFTNYGNPYDVDAGVKQCANDVFLEPPNIAAYPCWTAP
ncbi:MAG: hypothetical protein ACYDER_24270 [Ktedonobacteraceae bacterium]